MLLILYFVPVRICCNFLHLCCVRTVAGVIAMVSYLSDILSDSWRSLRLGLFCLVLSCLLDRCYRTYVGDKGVVHLTTRRKRFFIMAVTLLSITGYF